MRNDRGMRWMHYIQSSASRDRDIELGLVHMQAADGGLIPEFRRAIDGKNE
jgi:hypothetical protein